MAHNLAAELLTPPQGVLEMLSKSLNYGALGHTPRPSSSEKKFIDGVRDLSSNKLDKAVEHFSEAVAAASRELEGAGADIPNNIELAALSKGALGYVQALTGQTESAIKLYAEVLPLWQKIHGEKSAKLTSVYNDIAVLTELSGAPQAAFDNLKAYQSILIEASGADSMDALALSLSLASIKSRQGQVDEAEAIFLETIATLKKQDKPEVLQGLSMYQQHLLAHKKADKAKEVKAEISSIQQALKAQKQQRK